MTRLVSRLAVPRPGDRFRLEYDPADRSRLAVREALPVEPRQESRGAVGQARGLVR
jgi:hypothetical protein